MTKNMQDGDRGWLASPWPWLAYLPFYCIPWLWQRPSTAQLIAFAVALLLFLPTYILSDRLRGARLMAASALVLGIGIVLSQWGGSWTVFPIYAAAMAGTARPARLAVGAIWCTAAITTAVGLILGQPLLFWVPGVMLVVMTGLGTVSRKNLHEHNRALAEAQDEVRRLSRTAERERIARDLHDLVGRSLTLVALKSDVAARLIASDPARAEREMRGVAEVAREGLAEVRASLAGMAGGSLGREAEAARAALAAAGIDATLDGDPETISPEAGAVLAMTLREAVTNVIRHAGATQCRLSVAAANGVARLAVVDDGCGGSFREGFGLSGMRQRLTAAGGSLTLGTADPGTRIEATVPA